MSLIKSCRLHHGTTVHGATVLQLDGVIVYMRLVEMNRLTFKAHSNSFLHLWLLKCILFGSILILQNKFHSEIDSWWSSSNW